MSGFDAADAVGHVDPDDGEPVNGTHGTTNGSNGQSAEPSTAIDQAWRPLDPAWMTEPPPPRRWLLRHPTRDGHPVAQGHGDAPVQLGDVGMLVSAGGVGKTKAVMSLGVSVVTG